MLRLGIILSVLLLSGCAGKHTFDEFRVSVGLLSPYNAALKDFKHGEMMLARQRLLSVKKDDEDYKKSRQFLNDKVEPARLKLLRYYAQKGKSEEKLKHWARAEEAFKTAATLSRSPKALLKYEQNMNIKVRQLRAEALFKLRFKEDKARLQWKDDYNPPMGLLGDDVGFSYVREHVSDVTETYMDETWKLAQKFKKLGLPELAWVYADSYLRLNPDAEDVLAFKVNMANQVPKALRLPHGSANKKIKVTKSARSSKRKVVSHNKVTKEEVEKLIKNQKWAEAKKAAQSLRRQGNSAADGLLQSIDKTTEKLAEKSYEKGNIAFRKEQIDRAVVFWKQAVELKPHKQLYVDSLERGQKVQERLSVLKR